MMRLIIRLVINAVALWVAAFILRDYMSVPDNVVGLAVVALIFGVVNAFIKPIVALLTCPINALTLGLFTFVINALMLMLTGWLSQGQLQVSSFWWALVASVIVSLVSWFLSMFLDNGD